MFASSFDENFNVCCHAIVQHPFSQVIKAVPSASTASGSSKKKLPKVRPTEHQCLPVIPVLDLLSLLPVMRTCSHKGRSEYYASLQLPAQLAALPVQCTPARRCRVDIR